MNEIYQNKKTKVIYRVYHKSKECLIVFKQGTKQYFDGLWELETTEDEIGTYKTIDECFAAML